MVAFGRALPAIRRRVERHLAGRGLSRNKVLATVVKLLEVSLIRVGNEEYARDNESFGLTTLRNQHVKVRGDSVKFRFRGKSGKWHEVGVQDPRLARVIRRCQDLPGQELFEYIDENGERQDVKSSDVNDYVREISGRDFTAKDFRTWAGTVLAAQALQEFEQFDTTAQAKKNVVKAIESVASRLGNTPAICRKCYVHPEVINAYLDGALARTLKEKAEKELGTKLGRLPPEEAAVLAFLQRRLAAASEPLERILKRSLRSKSGRRPKH